MNNKTLGTLALLGAPFLGIGLWSDAHYPNFANTWFSGLWGFIYITAWLGSMVALRRMQVTGSSRFGRGLLWVITGTLLLADLSNLWLLVAPTSKPTLFLIFDAGWPISNWLMIAVGITTVVAGRLQGWKRFVPLFCGMWLPIALFTRTLPPNDFSFPLIIAHTVLAWSLLAVVVLSSSGAVKRAPAEAVPA